MFASINFCRQNNIILLSIPPHTSHQLQSLDRTFIRPLKTYYSQEIDKWLVNHPGKRISDFDDAEIFNGAYERTANVQKAIKGFECTGIMPYYPVMQTMLLLKLVMWM